MRSRPFWKLFAIRLAVVTLLVQLTYNISGMSYLHWVAQPFEGFDSLVGALKVLGGVLLFVLYIALLWATWRAKGPYGIALMFLVLGAFVYVAWAGGVLDFHNPTINMVVVQAVVIVALTVGSTWSILWRRITGQVSVEDPDTEQLPE